VGEISGHQLIGGGICGWQRMGSQKMNKQQSKPATGLDLGYKLRTTDSKTELCKG
jgi:hypothetical protein